MTSSNAASNVIPFRLRYPHSHDSSARYPQNSGSLTTEFGVYPQSPEAPEVPQYVGAAGDHDADGEGADWPRLSPSEEGIMRRQVDAGLARLGVCYRGRIWRLFSLWEVNQALTEVEDCLRTGQRIVNPAGLLVRVLEGNTGRSVFR